MAPRHMRTAARAYVLGAAIVSLLPALADRPTLAQRVGSRPSTAARAEALRDISREHLGRQISKQFERERISLLPQIREDFARMQVVNNRMMSDVFQLNALDYQHILDATAEIRRRAGRLRTNLRLPAPEGTEEAPKVDAPSDAAALKESLLLLDRSIMSFVKNPLFQQVGALDARHSARASHDLKAIIEISRAIRKGVERLARGPAPGANQLPQP